MNTGDPEQGNQKRAGSGASRCPFHVGTGDSGLTADSASPHLHPFHFSFGDMLRACARAVLGEPASGGAPLPEGYTAIPDLSISKRRLIAELLKNPLKALTVLKEEGTDTVQYRAPNDQLLVLTRNPDIVHAVLLGTDRGTAGMDTSDKSIFISEGGQSAFGKRNVIADSNQEWKQQRTALNRTFGRRIYEHPDKIAEISDIVYQQLDRLRERILESPTKSIHIELQGELSTIALRVALGAIFGKRDIDDETVKRLHSATRTVLKDFPLEAATPFSIPHAVLSLFSSRDEEIVDSQRFIEQFAEKLLQEEELNPSDPPTAVTGMVEGLRTRTGIFDREVVLNNIKVLLVAGHETSGNVIAYAIANLALRDACAAPVIAEASDPKWHTASSLTELRAALPFTRQAIEESLRLHPPFYVLLRRTTSDVTVQCPTGTFLIPKDTEVILDVFGAQRDPRYWGEERTGYPAEQFFPERWGQENISAHGLSNQDLDLFSFGLGSRVCLGQHLFWSEALPFIAKCMTDFTFTPHFKDVDDGMNGDLSLQREGGYPVTVSLRSGGERAS